MKVPETFDKKLEMLIDQHTVTGLLPGKYVINYFQIIKDLQVFIDTAGIRGSNILLFGSRTLSFSEDNIICFDDRDQYREFHKMQGCNTISVLKDIRKDLTEYDAIILFSDYFAEMGCKQDWLYHLNDLIEKRQKLFLVTYNWSDFSNYLYIISDDGFGYNSNAYRKWRKITVSHMHMGYNETSYKSMIVSDLCYTY